MPLHVGPRAGRAGLWITGTVTPAGAKAGIRIRQRAGSVVAALAREEAAAIEARILRDHHHGPGRASHTFGEAAISYLKHAPRREDTKALIRRLLPALRHKTLDQIGQDTLDGLRDSLLGQDATPSTTRRAIVTPVRAILTHAARRGWCDRPMFDVPREPRGRTTFLLPPQAEALIAAGGHLAPLMVFLIGTGCRAGEALRLEWTEVDLPAARVLLYEGETKSGERRLVHLPPAVVAALAGMEHRSGILFRTARQRGIPGGYARAGALRKLWGAAVARAGLPATVTPHVMRHSWASWHYALHRDLLLLKRDGGWAVVAMCERYAHLMPSGHEAGIRRVWGLLAEPEQWHQGVTRGVKKTS